LESSLEEARSGGVERRWKINAGEVLVLRMNIYNQTEVQESIYSVSSYTISKKSCVEA
jgi:hypothetical protein